MQSSDCEDLTIRLLWQDSHPELTPLEQLEKAFAGKGWFQINQEKMGDLPVFANKAKQERGITESISSIEVNKMVKFIGTNSGLQPGVVRAYSCRKSAYEASIYIVHV
jgi:hypothetical protein